MTEYFYSPETGGFYIKPLHRDIPEDVIQVEEEMYVDLMQAQHQGKTIVYEGEILLAQDNVMNVGWERVKTMRNRLLAESDWVFGGDSPVSEETKAQWKIYRKELRDLPTTFDDPVEVIWPNPPTSN